MNRTAEELSTLFKPHRRHKKEIAAFLLTDPFIIESVEKHRSTWSSENPHYAHIHRKVSRDMDSYSLIVM